MSEFYFETKLVKNKVCHYFTQDGGYKYFICMKESEGCKATLSVKYDIENFDAEPTITR